MAGIITDISDDIRKLQQVKAEIAGVKNELKGIDIRVNLDIKENIEARLKSLTEQYNTLVQRIAKADGEIMIAKKKVAEAINGISSDPLISFDAELMKMCGNLNKYFDGLLDKVESISSLLQIGKTGINNSVPNNASAQQLEDLRVKNADLTEQLRSQKEEIKHQQEEWNKLATAIKTNNVSAIEQYKQATNSSADAVKSAKSELKDLTKDLNENIKYYDKLAAQIASYKSILDRLYTAKDKGLTRVHIGDGATALISSELERFKPQLDDVTQKSKEITTQILEQRKRQAELNAVIEQGNEKHTRTRILIMDAREQMIQMRSAGLQNTAQYQQVGQEAAKMRTQMALVNAEMEYFSNPNKNLLVLKTGLQGIAGSASLVVGIMGFFNQKSEEMIMLQTKIQSLLGIIVGLETTYNTVRKTGILMRAVEDLQTKALIASQALEAKAKSQLIALTWLEVAAQKALSAVAKVNPYIILGTAILTVVGGMALLIKATREAKSAAKDLLSVEQEMALARKKAISDSTKERTELDLLYKKLKDTSLSTKERTAAVNEWMKKYPQHSNIMNGELISLNKLEAAYQSLSKQIIESAKARAYTDKITELETKKDEALLKRQNQYVTYLKAIDDYDKAVNEYNEKKETGFGTATAKLEAENKMLRAEQNIKDQKKAWMDLISETKAYEQSISIISKKIKADDLYPHPEKGTYDYWEQQVQIADAALKQIDSKQKALLDNAVKDPKKDLYGLGIDKSIVDSYKQAIKLKAEADKELKAYDDSSKQESAAEKLRKEQEKLSNQTIKNDLSLNAERLAILEDGRKKRLLQSEQEWEEKKAQLDKEYKERLAADKKNNLTTPQEVTDTYKARLDINDKAKEKRDANINKDADKEFMEHQKELTAFMLTEEETRQKAIKERYDKEREWAKNKYEGGDITETQYKEYNVSIDNAESQEILKGLLDEYQDYTTERLAIETKFNNDIAALDEQRKAAEKKGDTKQVEKIDRAKAQATKEKGKALMGADYEQLKKSPEYVRAFENLKKTSSETLTSLLAQLENAKQAAAEVLAPDELREYTSTIQDVMDELDSRNPFKALADRKKELAEAEEELARAKKNLDAVQSGGKVVKSTSYNKETDKIEKTYLSSAEALEKYNKAKDKSVGLDTEVHEAERKVDDVMGELFDSIQNLGSAIGGEAGEIIGVIGDIGQFALMAMNGVESSSKTASAAIQTVEKASVILAIISAAIQVATKIASLFQRTDYMEEFRKEMEKLNYELELAKLNAEISAEENNIFGDDLWKNAIKNVELANEALDRYNGTLEKIKNRKIFSGFAGATAEAMGLKNTFNSLGDSIANMQVQVQHKTWFRSTKYKSLKDAVPELFNADGTVSQDALEKFIGSDTFKKLSEENQKYLQEMSDYWKSYQEAVEQVKDYLTDIFGDLGGTLTDTLVDSWVNGTDAATAYYESVSEMLENLSKQMIYSAVFSDIFEKAQQKMLDVTQNADLSADEKFAEYIKLLGSMTDEVIGKQGDFNALLEAYQKMAKDKGFDIFNPESADSAKENLESFISSMQSALTSLEVTAKDVSDNIYDYFRQAMINALYEKEYKSKMEELYKTFEDLSADGLSESDMAQLNSQINEYINQMMKGVEDVNGLFAEQLKEAEDSQALDSFVENVKSAFSSIEATAEDVTDNIFEYIRQQMVEKMFADTFQPQIEEFYKRVQEAMSDGSITDAEKDALRSEAEKLANDIVAAKDILSDTLGITSNNLKKELEEEFKSFSGGILNSLYNAEVTAESVSKDIAESMRKELIEAMYIEQYEPRIKAIWEKWKECSADGLVTDEERANIKNDIDELGKEVADAAKEISDAWTDSGEDVKKAFESFSDSIKNVLYDAEATAEDVANNIYQYMRNALVDSMFTAQLKPQIQAWYDKYTEFMADGAIDTAERKTLDEMIAEIQKAGVDIVDAANALFPSLDTGAIKRAEEAAQEAENARNEAEQEWESFSDDILNSLYDIEATAEDISDDMGEYMRKALIKAMYVNNFKPQMQKWYNEWQKAMGDDNLTSEEKQTLDAMKQTMVDDMKKEVDAINQFFGTMYSQQASSKGFEAMSQDTGEELNGRFTALQVAGEEIKNQAVQQTGLLSSINNKLSLLNLRSEDIPALRSGNFNIADRTREVIASGYQSQINVVFPTDDIRTLTDKVSNMERIVDELRTFQIEKFTDVVEGVTKISKNTPQMNDKLDRINENIKRAL